MRPIEPTVPLEPHEMLIHLVGAEGDESVESMTVIRSIDGFVSEWQLNDKERAEIALGANINLSMMGNIHPAVSLWVQGVVLVESDFVPAQGRPGGTH